jgi:hypothetical protein
LGNQAAEVQWLADVVAVVGVATMAIVMAPTGQRCAHLLQPVQRSASCITAVLRQAVVSKAISGR